MSLPNFDKDMLWYSREKDADWLAEQLRASRLTVLQGQSGSGKTVLMRWGVLPRLRRRATDPATTVTATPVPLPEVDRSTTKDLAGRPRVVIPFPDRRRNAAQPSRDVEIVVYVDDWGGRPLEALHAALREAIGLPPSARGQTSDLLVEALDNWHRERGLRFLFVLDNFDECLKASIRDPGARDFVDQWVQAVSHPLSPAHFLVAMQEPAEPLWRLLTEHLRTLGHLADHRLQLQGVSLVPPPAVPASVPAPAQAQTQSQAQSQVQAAPVDHRPADAAQPEVQPPVRIAPATAPAPAVARTPAPSVEPAAAFLKDPSPLPPMATARVATVSTPKPPPLAETVDLPVEEIAVPSMDQPGWISQSDDGVNFSGLQDASHSARVDTSIPTPPVVQRPSRRDPRPTPRAARKSRQRPGHWSMPISLVVIALVFAVGWWGWDRYDKGLPFELQVGDVKLALPMPMPMPSRADTRDERLASSSGATAPGTNATPFELVADAGDSSDSVLLGQLAQALTPAGQASPAVRFPFGYAAEIQSMDEQPRFSIFTNDMLQATRRTPGATPLQVITPLFNDEIYFVVRADSPLRYIHQIRNAHINVGPARGARALTANSVYDRLFGRPIPMRQLDTDGRETALDELLGHRSVDVVVLVGPQPDPWLEGLSPARKRQLRVLELDARHWSTRKVVASYPATTVTPDRGTGLEAPGGTHTLAMRTFLVAAAPPSPDKRQAFDAAIAEAATALCRNLPQMQSSGHPKWREVQPALQVDTAWPDSAAADEAFRRCGTRP